jgi:hypothetical protein
MLLAKDCLIVVEAKLIKLWQAYRDLPTAEFMKQVEGGALIDAGVDVGLPFKEAKPDIGAFGQ